MLNLLRLREIANYSDFLELEWPGTPFRVPGHAMADARRATANAYAVQLAFIKFAVVVPLLFVVVWPLKWM
jgi:hypothetical protein